MVATLEACWKVEIWFSGCSWNRFRVRGLVGMGSHLLPDFRNHTHEPPPPFFFLSLSHSLCVVADTDM